MELDKLNHYQYLMLDVFLKWFELGKRIKSSSLEVPALKLYMGPKVGHTTLWVSLHKYISNNIYIVSGYTKGPENNFILIEDMNSYFKDIIVDNAIIIFDLGGDNLNDAYWRKYADEGAFIIIS